MLSRTADHLFWMARYMERAENTARMLDVNYQTSLLPLSEDSSRQLWTGLLSISELTAPFAKKYDEIEARNASLLGEATDIAAEAVAQRFGRGAVDAKIQAHIVTIEK